ncbi:hypothetical protein AVEN_70029-1 [Araneus ventricosus]|uniref:Uncharacterized protein n=1 Tax=Araneus ventricosus TaxID=182803 RepID=A0A4Y2UN10_ARAVE|nr:hypothetical protein AVEN_24473-1 [Araneus ventricosus]GBO13622.1 hypothetical protein AVEN_70029-1 [Araneus ventricosus]
MSLAYAECPLDVRESLAIQYDVDAIKDEDTQHSTRLIGCQDIQCSLNKAPEEGLRASALSVGKDGLFLKNLFVESRVHIYKPYPYTPKAGN